MAICNEYTPTVELDTNALNGTLAPSLKRKTPDPKVRRV